jgi:hypothetical protein
MADYEDIKARIITSVFNKRRQTTGIAEFHVCHQKIWEDTDDGAEKPRYILLSSCVPLPVEYVIIATERCE